MDYRGMTVADLDVLMTEVKDARAKAVKAERGNADAGVREQLKAVEKGATLVVIFKGQKTEVAFVGLTDKRFTVEVDGVKRSVQFDKLVEIV